MLAGIYEHLSRVRQKLNYRFQLTMQKKLPRRTKRIIFAAAIAGWLENTDTLSAEHLSKLNAVLHLAKSEEALKLPVYLNEVIWRGYSLDSLHVLEETSTDIVKWTQDTVPFWLRYGRASDMVSDAMVVRQLVTGRWSEDAVRTAKHRFRGFTPVGQVSSFEPSHI